MSSANYNNNIGFWKDLKMRADESSVMTTKKQNQNQNGILVLRPLAPSAPLEHHTFCNLQVATERNLYSFYPHYWNKITLF